MVTLADGSDVPACPAMIRSQVASKDAMALTMALNCVAFSVMKFGPPPSAVPLANSGQARTAAGEITG